MSKLEQMTAGQANAGQANGNANPANQAGTGPVQQPPAELPKADAPKVEAPKIQAPKKMRVLDTTAVDGPRVHQQIVNDAIQSFTFEPGKGLEMPPSIAVKFLKHDAFKCVDELGNVLEWRRAPKQPDELGAGEKIKLLDTETIARVDELSKGALLQRALEMPGGEKFTPETPRAPMIAFIIETTTARRKAKEARPDNGPNDFVPEADLDEDAA